MKILTTFAFAFAFAVSPLFAQDDVAKARKFGHAKPITIDAEKEVYGAQLKGDKDVVTLAALLKEPKAWDGKNVQIRGKIANVCVKKGCWMMLKDEGKDLRVTFKNYKFFVPLDVSGREVAAEGKVLIKVETEAERRHYAEDAGKTPEEIAKIVGDVTSVSLVADAVQIGKLPPLPKTEKCCGDSKAESTEGCCGESKPKTEGCCGEVKEKSSGGCCSEKKQDG